MARRAAGKGRWRPRKPSPSSAAAGDGSGAVEDAPPQAPRKGSAAAAGGVFFCCYLLRSQCPRLKGRTYIGFTVNPRRRIRQHNGEISSGAWKTRRGRPWEMVLCIHGFPTNVAALQFEWAWQNPKESLAVRTVAAGFKSLSGAGNKVRLAYAMLSLPSWEKLNLTVNFFSSASSKFAAGCPPLPSQMKTVVCPLEDLQCHAEVVREDQCTSSVDEDVNNDPQNHHNPPDSPHRDQHSDHPWKQQSTDQVQAVDAQSGIAVFDVNEYDDSSDEFGAMELDGILDLTEPDGSRTSPQYSLSSDGDDDGVVEDEFGQGSAVWKVSVGSDGGDELGHASPTPMLNIGSDSDCGDSGVMNAELGQVSPVRMVNAGSDEGEKDAVVDLVTPIPVSQLGRRPGAGYICPRIIDLTASPAVIEL